jgi:glycosyltransferase involved in cell wall biosynthesis
MRVMLAASNLGCNGAVVYARRLAPLLIERGYKVWLAAHRDSWIAQETQGEVPLFDTDFSRWPLTELKRTADFCRKEGIQIFHSHLTRASNFGVFLQVLHGVPSLAHLHANHLQLHPWFHRKVVAVSADTLSRWRRRGVGFGQRGRVLPNFVDPLAFAPASGEDRLRSILGVPAETPVLLVVGTVNQRKGQDLAVRALPLIRHHFPSAVLALVGGGALPKELISTPGLVQLGHRTDIAELLPWATLSIVPSRDEPFGLAAIEAMACGVPVLTSGAGGLKEVVAGGAGATFRADDFEDLAQHSIRLLRDEPQRRLLIEAGHKRVHQNYLPTPHLAALEVIYEELVGAA